MSVATHPRTPEVLSRKPGKWVYHLGEFVAFDDARLPLTTQALHYGTGVFEGIRGYAAPGRREVNLFRVDEHYRRFLRSCRMLHIDPLGTAEDFSSVTIELLQRNGSAADVYIRPLAYKSALLPGSPPGVGLRGVSDAVSIITHTLPAYHPRSGIRCAVSSWRRPHHAAIPVQAKLTGAYVNCALAVDEARASGYDDVIILNDRGHVAEASTANVFMVRAGRAYTPPLTAGILAGITRDTVLVLAAEAGVDTVERDLEIADVLLADEVFLTGTGVGVVPVVQVAGRRIGDGTPGPIASALADRYDALVRGVSPVRDGWVTKVELD